MAARFCRCPGDLGDRRESESRRQKESQNAAPKRFAIHAPTLSGQVSGTTAVAGRACLYQES
jgi:hypothetical protein